MKSTLIKNLHIFYYNDINVIHLCILHFTAGPNTKEQDRRHKEVLTPNTTASMLSIRWDPAVSLALPTLRFLVEHISVLQKSDILN